MVFNGGVSQFRVLGSTSQSFSMILRPWQKMQERLGHIASIEDLNIGKEILSQHVGWLCNIHTSRIVYLDLGIRGHP